MIKRFSAHKKILAFTLAVCLLLSWTGVFVFADDNDIAYGISETVSRAAIAEESAVSPTAVVEEGEVDPAAAVLFAATPVVIALGHSGFDLLDGVTARDEAGTPVPVTLESDGGFDLATKDTYYPTYTALHPLTGEQFSAERSVTVYPFDSQPATVSEVEAAITAWESEAAAKPRWQHQADTSLMPAGWRSDFLEEEVGGVTVTYWSFFPTPMPMAGVITTADDLQTAITAAEDGAVITIGGNIQLADLTNADKALTIAADGRTLLFQSATGGEVTITAAPGKRHILLSGGQNAALELKFDGAFILDGDQKGGGILGDKNTSIDLTLHGAKIQNCAGNAISANNNGGAISIQGSVTATDSLITGNTAGYGGGIWATNGLVRLIGSTVSSNSAISGGGIWASKGTTVIIEAGSVISDNMAAPSYGGGIYIDDYGSKELPAATAQLSIKDSEILRNRASSVGGGMYIGRFTSADITGNTVIDGNTSGRSGGGIFAEISGAITIEGLVKISNNRAAQSGGGIISGTSLPLTIKGPVVFEKNEANLSDYTPNHGGGAIGVAQNTNVFIQETSQGRPQFVENVARYGGAIYFTSTIPVGHGMTISGADFVGNRAINTEIISQMEGKGGSGGAIYAHYRPNPNSKSHTQTLIVENATFRENTADLCGGALYLCGGDIQHVTLRENTFHGNSAVKNGGAISIGGDFMGLHSPLKATGIRTVTVESGTFSNNTAGAGGAIYSNFEYDYSTGDGSTSRLFINGGEFIHNEATGEGGAIYMEPYYLLASEDRYRDLDEQYPGWGFGDIDPYFPITESQLQIHARPGETIVFSGNSAGTLYSLQPKHEEDYAKTVNGVTVSATESLFNNYDVSYTFRPKGVTYTVTYHANNGTDKTIVEQGATTVRSAEYLDFVYTDHTFFQWNILQDGSGTAYDTGESLTASIDLYAQWTPNTPPPPVQHTVSFDLDSIDATPAVIADRMVEHGSAVGPLPQPSRTDYAFKGWFTEKNGGGSELLAESIVDQDLTVYAHWEAVPISPPVQYTVTFDLGYEGAPTADTRKVEHGQSLGTEMPADPLRDGYRFLWWLEEDGTVFDSDRTVLNDMTVHAQWKSDEVILSTAYIVTFDLGYSGAPQAETKKVTLPATTVDGLPTQPVRASYTFQGWNTQQDGSGMEFTAATSVNSDLTVYAQWKAIETKPPGGDGSGRPSTITPGGGSSGGGGGYYLSIDDSFTPTDDQPAVSPYANNASLASSPNTGDGRNLAAVWVAMGISGACLLGGVFTRRRKQASATK